MRRFRESEVNMPSGNVDKPLIEDNRDGTVSVKYEPKEEGLHELVVKYNGENVQETSKPSEPLPTTPTVGTTDQSADSQVSADFVPTVQPPVGWLQTTASSLGRWRQQQDDPYQALFPPQSTPGTDEGDGRPGSDGPTIDRQLHTHIEKLKKSTMTTDCESRARIKPEWVQVVEQRLSARERGPKPRSFLSSRSRKVEEIRPKEVESQLNSQSADTPKCTASGKDPAVDEDPCNASVDNNIENRASSSHEEKDPSSDNRTAVLVTYQLEDSTVRCDSRGEKRSEGLKAFQPITDPFTFGKQLKATDTVSWNTSGHPECRQSSAKSGFSRRVSKKEGLTTSSSDARDFRALSTSSGKSHCICKEFERKKSDPVESNSGEDGRSHAVTGESLKEDKAEYKRILAKKASCPKDGSVLDNPVSQGILKMSKASSKKSSGVESSRKEKCDSKTFVSNARSTKTEYSVELSAEGRSVAPDIACNMVNSTKTRRSLKSTKGKRSDQSGISEERHSEERPALKINSHKTKPKGKEISSQTHTIATKTLKTQTSRETEEITQRTETSSQTDVTNSPSAETRAGGSQTDGPTPPERPHSITLVVPARKPNLPSPTTESAVGDPPAPCSSTLSAGFIPGCGIQSEALSFATSAQISPQHPSPTAVRSQPAFRSTLSVPPEPRRCRSSAKIVDTSHDSFVPAAAALSAGAAPRRLAPDELSLSSRCSTVAESGGFLSARSSNDSLRSALPASETIPPPRRAVLGIPMARPAEGGTAGRAAERQRKRCSRALEQLGMGSRLRTSTPRTPDEEAVCVSWTDAAGSGGAGGGRPVVDGAVFRSATSVSEVAPCSGGDGKQSWGRWRRTVAAERPSRSVDSEEVCYGRAAVAQSSHSAPGGSPTGSPFKFHVDSIASGYVTAHGPGLVHGITGEPANFTISTKDAGAGGLSLAVEGPSKAEISCHDNKDGTVSVSYLPTSPGEYKVAVKFADKHIKGSPYSVKVTGEGRKRNQVSLGSQSEVTLPGKVTEKDIKALNASITAPSGLEEPCFLKKLPNDHLGISFTPREIGQHLVMVKKKGVEIAGSPFKIMVSPKEVGDASKVKVSGDALKEGKTHQDNKVLIDTKEAGYGGLSMSIEGPSKAEIKCDDKDDGKLEVSYNPKEPGFYIINLKFADHHVQGSPFTAKVTGEGSNTQTERIKRDRDAAPVTTVGSSCALTFKMPGVSALDLSATVASPGGVVEDATITELEDNLHAVNFVPKELGVHTVSVRYRDVHIPGSPFQFTVGPLKDGGAHRVHAGGPGLERGEQNMPNEFNVWTREAGAGSLAISVEGPSKAEIDFKDRKDGSCYVSYVVSEPGEYRVGVKFNDSHIPESPYKVYVTPANKDAHRVSVNQLPDAGVQVDKPIVFTVDRSGCRGQLDCKVVSPSGQEDDCFAQYLDEDTYSVRFLPKENGIHQLHVKWNNVHVPGSPFRLKIGKQDADPAAVHAHGRGLEKGTTGQKSDFIVDTCNAGAGTLAVTIDGPSKVAMDCTEVDEGYKVRYTPLSPGHYYVGVKYDGYHIAGSPFKVDVEGDELAERGPKEQSAVVVETIEKVSVSKQENKGPSMPKFNSDATKVTSKGMGLKKAFVGRQNQFTVDAGKAGQDMLWVGCFGPKNPCEEVHIKHTGRNQYQVFYTVKERGKYILVVRWGEKDIPGSPFEVEV